MKTKTSKTPAHGWWALAIATTAAMAMTTPAFGQADSASGQYISVTLDAPKTSASVHLTAYQDTPANFDAGLNNPWYCAYGNGLESWARYMDNEWRVWKRNGAGDREFASGKFKERSDAFLAIKNNTTLKFWSSLDGNSLDFEPKPSGLSLNPSQGQKLSKTIPNCYTMEELDAGKREAVRWASYMHDIWLPAHKGGK